jgi:hypothetical protein
MDNMTTPFENRVLALQSIRECFFDKECTSRIEKGLNALRQQAKTNYEYKIRRGKSGSSTNYELYKIKLMDAIFTERDLGRATHWYAKWDEAVNDFYEEITINSDKFHLLCTDNETGTVGEVGKSGMLDSCGKIFAEEKNLFRFLITVI